MVISPAYISRGLRKGCVQCINMYSFGWALVICIKTDHKYCDWLLVLNSLNYSLITVLLVETISPSLLNGKIFLYFFELGLIFIR